MIGVATVLIYCFAEVLFLLDENVSIQSGSEYTATIGILMVAISQSA